ncbi:MAG: membrane protein [Candidatus Hydrogenedentota bacterium]
MQTEALHPKLDTLQKRALVVAIVGAVVLGAGAIFSGMDQFYQSYLYGFFFWNGLTLGCLVILMIHHMVGGPWGFMSQRILEAGTRLMPMMLILGLPILLGMNTLYPWTNAAYLDEHAIVREKLHYLNSPFFIGRYFFYYAVWIVLAFALSRLSKRLEETGDQRNVLWMRWTSGPGIVAFVLTMTFAMTDWGMSLEPIGFSTMYPVIFIVGNFLATWSFLAIILSIVSERPPHSKVMTIDFFHHIGNFMLGFTVLWAYTSFSQFLITWSGNLPEEIPYYLNRTGPSQQVLAMGLMAFHFAVPMFLLFWKRAKRNVRPLVMLAFWIIAMRFVDLHWILNSAFHPGKLSIHYMDIAAPVAIGGLWLFAFVAQLRKRPLLPGNDDRMIWALAKYAGHDHDEHHDHGEAVKHA